MKFISSVVLALAVADEHIPSHMRGRYAVHKGLERDIQSLTKKIDEVDDQDSELVVVADLTHAESTLAQDEKSEGRTAEDVQLERELSTAHARLCIEQADHGEVSDGCKQFMARACSYDDAGAHVTSVGSTVNFNGVEVSLASESDCSKFFLAEQSESSKAEADAKVVAEAAAQNSSGNSSGLFGGKKERPLPESGYNEYGNDGLVEHDDAETMTKDWLQETVGHKSYKAICKEYPDSQWCKMHMHRMPVRRKEAGDHTFLTRVGEALGLDMQKNAGVRCSAVSVLAAAIFTVFA